MQLPKLGKVYCKVSRQPQETFKSLTIAMTADGQFFPSCLYETSTYKAKLSSQSKKKGKYGSFNQKEWRFSSMKASEGDGASLESRKHFLEALFSLLSSEKPFDSYRRNIIPNLKQVPPKKFLLN